MPEKDEMLAVIRRFVLRKRQGLGITRLPGPQPELSCLSFGEFRNLLWRGLLFSPEPWRELDDPQILEGVYKEVLEALS